MANEQLTLDFFDDLPEKPDAEQIARITLKHWREHLKKVGLLESQITKFIDAAVKEAARLGKRIKPEDIGRAFEKTPTLRKALDSTMQKLAEDLTATIEQGSKEAWLRSNNTGNAIIAQMAAGNAALAALLQAQQTKPQNDRALLAFQKREEAGMNLSERVWKIVEATKRDMERAVEVALAEGTPASKLGQRVHQLLQEPNRLYRRVRDKDGNLRLSQAAQQYKPGRGVYRSSYKNAMRLARTEVNMAYHTADNERWAKSWWVRGIRIWLSNNHTVKDSKGHPQPLVDICDELMGDYPADFKFTGWHPQCRCIATALTCSYADIREYYRRKRAEEDMSNYTPPGIIKEPPAAFKNWLADNSDRLTSAAERGVTPYFIKDNAKYAGSGKKVMPPASSQTPPINDTLSKVSEVGFYDEYGGSLAANSQSGRTLQGYVASLMGRNGKPTVVSENEFKQIFHNSDDNIIIYRGFRKNETENINNYKYGRTYDGNGGMGEGQYFATTKLADFSENGEFIEAIINTKRAKIGDYASLESQWLDERKEFKSRPRPKNADRDDYNLQKEIFEDFGRWATLRGYDAYTTPDDRFKEYVVLNRAILIVKK